MKFENGKPRGASVLGGGGGEAGLANVFSRRLNLENVVGKTDTRLRIFSGTANPALSQVSLFESAELVGTNLGVSS